MDKLLDLLKHVYTTNMTQPAKTGAPPPVAMIDAQRRWTEVEPTVRREIEDARNSPAIMELLKRWYPQVFE